MANVLIFGDSITLGAWDTKGGWADRLKRYFYQRSVNSKLTEYNEVYNLGRSGDTTNEIVKRFDSETKVRMWGDPLTILIFAVGVNDSIIIDNIEKVPTNKFKKNVEKIIQKAQKYTDKIVFLDLLPVDESKVSPIPWSPRESLSNNSIDKYNNILKTMIDASNCRLVNVSSDFAGQDYKSLLEDGVHPNSRGHELIYEKVSDFLHREYLRKWNRQVQ
jgi:lysophospholipase L1-like esterase